MAISYQLLTISAELFFLPGFTYVIWSNIGIPVPAILLAGLYVCKPPDSDTSGILFPFT